jgi:transcriptional regulator with XRE-family HTH domain
MRRLRIEDKGWTKEELARRADISAQTVRKAERGESVSEISQARLAKALGVTVEKLFPKS